MRIASQEFLLFFLPVTVGAFYLLCNTQQKKRYCLLFASLVFYGLVNLDYIPLIFLLSFITFWTARKNQAVFGILLNLSALLVFKYWNFFAENLNLAVQAVNSSTTLPITEWLLPLGISYFTFKHIGYLLDVKNSLYPPTENFLTFLSFTTYFPQISAGPISSFKDTGAQLAAPVPDRSQFLTGLLYISVGLTKKIFISDALGVFLNSPFNAVDGFSGMAGGWLIVLVFSLQLYFDFSAYTDLAIGVSLLFGIRLPENFNNPYLAANPVEFWQRWHMSLSRWFQVYLFNPISRFLLKKLGSEKRSLAQYTANLLTMTLVGFWHGAAWNFVLWGFYHGVLLNISYWRKNFKNLEKSLIYRGLFLLSLMFGWAFFMAPDSRYLLYMLKQLLYFNGFGIRSTLSKLDNFTFLPALLGALLLIIIGRVEAKNLVPSSRRSFAYTLIWGIFAALSVILLQGNREFLYVQF